MSKTSPTHYTLPDGTQVYDITQHFDFTVGNCIKYLMRAGNKDGESSLDDLKKCQWYLSKLIEREELKNESGPRDKSDSAAGCVRLCPPSTPSHFVDGRWID